MSILLKFTFSVNEKYIRLTPVCSPEGSKTDERNYISTVYSGRKGKRHTYLLHTSFRNLFDVIS